MKKSRISALAAITAVVLAASFLCGCSILKPNSGSNDPISIPTAEPTGVPTVLDNETLGAFIGDWYGVYTVSEARGVYAPNAYVSNDCAMRVSVDDYGKGVCYLQVNGMGRNDVSGSTNVFALCTAAIRGDSIELEGMIDRSPIEWSIALNNGLLHMTEVYGDVDNYMRIELDLCRPDAFATSSLPIEAMDYIFERGFVGIVDKLGGSSAELPSITVPEGCDPHIFFTSDEPIPTEEPVPDNTVLSADGHIMLTLPEGYEVIGNTVMDFSVASPETNVRSVEFTVSEWSSDALSFLLGSTQNVTELYHYTIDGFDFYGTFIEGEPSEDGPIPTAGSRRPTSIFKLCGTDGSGMLMIITANLDMDAYSAYTWVNVENADFTELILGAKFFKF